MRFALCRRYASGTVRVEFSVFTTPQASHRGIAKTCCLSGVVESFLDPGDDFGVELVDVAEADLVGADAVWFFGLKLTLGFDAFEVEADIESRFR